MKHISIYILSLFTSLSLQSQVTINTKNLLSKTVWHLDGSGDNATSVTDAQSLNDVVISTEGKVGIGTVAPSMQLDIKTRSVPALHIEDGWQAQGRVLTSDAYGVGRWQPFGASVVQIISVDKQTLFTIADVILKYLYSDISFTLAPGLWMIETNILIFRDTSVGTGESSFGKRVWIKSVISDSSTSSTVTSDILQGGPKQVSTFLYAVAGGFNMMNGFFIINNNSGADKTYHLWYGNVPSGPALATNLKYKFAGANESFMSATYIGEPR